MHACIKSIAPDGYAASAIHSSGRDWPETNCYTDVWIEILHASGFDPAAALGFTVAQDFEGDHFTFFKPPPEDLETLFGMRVAELAIYESVEAQSLEQISRGRLPLIEADSFYLPDTQGVSYRSEHTKSTIAINAMDPARRTMDYFHSAGFYRLDGEDYDGALGQLATQRDMLFPYAEFVKIEPQAPGFNRLEAAKTVLKRHLSKRPMSSPAKGLQNRLAAQVEQIGHKPPDFFHKYAFNTFRQMGANFELCASHLQWLASQGETGLDRATTACLRLSAEAKIMQFQLARAVARKRAEGLEAKMQPICGAYDEAMGELARHFPAEG